MLFNAAVLVELNRPLELLRLEIPECLSVGQVLVKILYSGICGSQLGEIAGVKGPDKYLPHTLGHEGSGIVLATGPGVKHVKVSDHVVLHWRKGAGIESEPPQYWCPELGRYVGSGWVTTFQDLSIVSENRLTKISKDIPLDKAALLGCAVTTGLGLVSNEAHVKMGQSVIVFGCGGVGLNIIQGSMLANAYPIIGLDIKQDKMQQAVAMGATLVVNSLFDNHDHLPIAEYLRKETAGGADIVVDTTGNADVMKLAWEVAAPTGKVFLVAQLNRNKHMQLQTLPMHTGKTITGSDGGQTNPTTDIPRYLKLYKHGRLNLDFLITHRVKLSEINTILDEIRTGNVGRAIICTD